MVTLVKRSVFNFVVFVFCLISFTQLSAQSKAEEPYKAEYLNYSPELLIKRYTTQYNFPLAHASGKNAWLQGFVYWRSKL